ncbi:hypothetical protein [Methylobacterium sp. A54F]
MRLVAARAMALTAGLLVVGAVRVLEMAGIPYPVEDCLLAAACATAVMLAAGW